MFTRTYAISPVKRNNFYRKSELQMFLLISGGHIGVPFLLTRGYAKRRNGFLWGLRYANVSLAHSGVESS